MRSPRWDRTLEGGKLLSLALEKAYIKALACQGQDCSGWIIVVFKRLLQPLKFVFRRGEIWLSSSLIMRMNELSE